MALKNTKLSTYDDLASANIDTTTELVVLTGTTKINANLPVTSFIEDSLTSTSVVKPLSAKQGKALQDTKAPIANPTFTGTVGGVTKAMVGLGDVDNTSDANKPISTAQAAGLAPKESPILTGDVTVDSIIKGKVEVDNLSHIIIQTKSGDNEIYLSSASDGAGNIGIKSGNVTLLHGGGLAGADGYLEVGSRGHGMTTVLKGDRINITTHPFDSDITLPVFADNAAALTGTLVDGDLYRTSTGVVMITYAV